MGLSIGAVIPNYNYARYLPERFASVQAQSRPVDCLVFLDDASTDDSWQVAEQIPWDGARPPVMARNTANSGDVLGQWRAGVARLETDLVWIAEADDRADPAFLDALAARLDADDAAIFAFCDSAAIGADGTRTAPNTQGYYAALGPNPLAADAVFTAEEFAAACLCPRNLVVSASAVLWRTRALAAALAAVAGESWRCAGDWRVYLEACQGGRIHYLAAPLSEHRRHDRSVTGSTPGPRHYAEVVAMHVLLRERLGATPDRDLALRGHLGDLRRDWRLPAGAAHG